jgi:hypothetical protein
MLTIIGRPLAESLTLPLPSRQPSAMLGNFWPRPTVPVASVPEAEPAEPGEAEDTGAGGVEPDGTGCVAPNVTEPDRGARQVPVADDDE